MTVRPEAVVPTASLVTECSNMTALGVVNVTNPVVRLTVQFDTETPSTATSVVSGCGRVMMRCCVCV